MSSRRLPGKVMLDLAGKPVLQHVVERVRRSRLLDDVVVATSTDSSDAPLVEFLRERGVVCHRGPLEDVLTRYVQAARAADADTVVRITADCPLIDPAIIDDTLRLHRLQDNDYTSNCVPPTYPDGLDVEVLSMQALLRADREAPPGPDREHVTLYINQSQGEFRLGTLRAAQDLSRWRLTLDEPEDYRLLGAIFEQLYPANPNFDLAAVCELLRRQPALLDINRHIGRNEGLQHSLAQGERQGGGGSA